MFTHLQAQREVKRPTEIERPRKVMGNELRRLDLQERPIYMRPIDAHDVVNAQLPYDVKPRSGAASHINNGGRLNDLEHYWQYNPGGLA
jgi:hypothetical protein